jgi:hypothetical protein
MLREQSAKKKKKKAMLQQQEEQQQSATRCTGSMRVIGRANCSCPHRVLPNRGRAREGDSPTTGPGTPPQRRCRRL